MSELIVIPSYIKTSAHAKLLNTCVLSINSTTDNAQILVVDDCSPHEKQAEVLYDYFEKNLENVSVIRKEENEGFSKTVNVGIEKARQDNLNVVLVNADIEFTDEGWLEEMRNTDADIIGALLVYPNSVIQHAGIYFSSFSRNFDHRFKGAPHDLPAAQKSCFCPVTAALQYVKSDVFDSIGLYDEGFKMGYEDVDFNIRAIEAGFKSIYNPKVKAVHHESVFRTGEKTDWEKESYLYLVKKHEDKNFSGIAPSLMESYE